MGFIEVVELMKERENKVLKMEDELFDLKTGLIGAEINHNGKNALIQEIDWKNSAVLINYDDENYEWVEWNIS